MNMAHEVRKLKWTIIFVSLIALFATGHLVGGIVVICGAYVEANNED